MNISEKHVIFGHSNHVFTNLYIDFIVKNNILNFSKILFLTIDDIKNNSLQEDICIDIDLYKNYNLSDLSKAKSFTFLSFHKKNSFILKDLYDCSRDNMDKAYVYLTDDEVDRWRKVKRKDGKIHSGNKKFSMIGEIDVEMLPLIKNFITSEKAFRKSLEDVLNRCDFNIIDARDPFATMPVLHTNQLIRIFENKSVHDKPDKKILFGSKRGCFSFIEISKLFMSLKKRDLLSRYKFLLFTDPKRRSLRLYIDLYCLYLSRVKNIVVDISFSTLSNSLTYTNLIMSCSHFILQGRGGISSARSYARAGRGAICVQKGTPNERELVDALSLDVISYESIDDLADKIATCKVDIWGNKLKMAADLENSCANLKSIYS